MSKVKITYKVELSGELTGTRDVTDKNIDTCLVVAFDNALQYMLPVIDKNASEYDNLKLETLSVEID